MWAALRHSAVGVQWSSLILWEEAVVGILADVISLAEGARLPFVPMASAWWALIVAVDPATSLAVLAEVAAWKAIGSRVSSIITAAETSEF